MYTVGRLDHAARLLFVDQSAKPILAVNPAGPDGYPVPRLHRPVLTGTLMRLGPLVVLAELRRPRRCRMQLKLVSGRRHLSRQRRP